MPKDHAHDQRLAEASPVVAKARALAAAGHHAAVVEFLGARDQSELAEPTLALLYGIAQARLGRHEQGLQWIDQALAAARQRREHGVERHALNARGAIALVSGDLTEAADFCTQALMAASRDGDHATTGRASNNLGIISHLRGRHAEAISSWEIAAAAHHRAGMQAGVADCLHNLANAYREQSALDKALATADQAVAAAEASHDEALYALTLRGRAEIRAVRSEPELARRELDRIRVVRGQMPDPVAEAEDLRIQALVLVVENQLPRAEKALREVIGRAELHARLLLQGEATRDLAVVLRRTGRTAEAQAAAQAAKGIFARMGAESEIRKLANQGWDEAFAAELRGSLAPIHVAQEYADAGKYAELLTYLEQRSKDELEESALLTLLLGIAHSRLGRLEVGQQWTMVAQLRARSLKDRMMEARAPTTSASSPTCRATIVAPSSPTRARSPPTSRHISLAAWPKHATTSAWCAARRAGWTAPWRTRRPPLRKRRRWATSNSAPKPSPASPRFTCPAVKPTSRWPRSSGPSRRIASSRIPCAKPKICASRPGRWR